MALDSFASETSIFLRLVFHIFLNFFFMRGQRREREKKNTLSLYPAVSDVPNPVSLGGVNGLDGLIP